MTTITAARIQAALPLMSDSGRSIVEDILARAERWGSPTPRQAALIAKIVMEAENRPAARETIDLTRINTMFDKAAAQLKRPFVNFLVDNVEMKISPAPVTGRNPNCLYVKQAGTYVGKIDAQGRFSAGRDALPGIVEALKAFAADPAKAALAYGQATGNCCFCAKELTDARSVEAGYGPICAGKWGLPWGV